MLLCTLIFIIGIVYPVIIRYVCHDPHPYKVLFASVAPMLLAFFSTDSNLVLPMNIRHGKESLGIRRRCSGFTYPLFSVFARGGSSLVATICFILIWRSYSSLNMPFVDVLWIFFASFGLSFLLGGIPSGSVFILLTIFSILSVHCILPLPTAQFGSYKIDKYLILVKSIAFKYAFFSFFERKKHTIFHEKCDSFFVEYDTFNSDFCFDAAFGHELSGLPDPTHRRGGDWPV